MTTKKEGMDATTVKEAGEDIKTVLQSHTEVLVIVVDPDLTHEGESKIATYVKLSEDKGVLSPMLIGLLRKLLFENDKQCSSISDKTPIGA